MRNKTRKIVGLAVVALAALWVWASPCAAGYHVLRKVVLGGEGGWDDLTVDAQARRLYISRSSHVMVVDADSLRVVGDIPDTRGVHAIAIDRASGRGFVSDGGDSSVTIFDLATLKVLDKVRVGIRPDAMVFDPFSKRVFTMNAGSRDATALDAASGTVVGTVPLGGRPEFAAADGRGRLFVNIEDSSLVCVVDTKDLRVLDRWTVAPGTEPSGLAMDRARGRLFSVCGNQTMSVLDAASGHVIATLPIGKGVDGAAFDPGAGKAFSSNGEGTVTVVGEDPSGKFAVLETVTTESGARTMALDAATHRLFLVTAQFGPAPAPTADHPRPRRPMVPGTFELLVVGE